MDWRSEAQVGEDRRGPSGLTKQWYRDAVRDTPSPACLFRSQSRFRRGSFSTQTTRLLRLHSSRSLRTEPLIFGEITVLSRGLCYGFTDKMRLQSQYIRRIWLNCVRTNALRENAYPKKKGRPARRPFGFASLLLPNILRQPRGQFWPNHQYTHHQQH